MIRPTTSPLQAPAAPGVPCVILDAAQVPGLQAHAAQAIGYGAECCVSLLEQTPYAALQAVGPFALLCPLPGDLMTYALDCLQESDTGCLAYLNDQDDFAQAVEHWRSLLTVRSGDGTMRMMRFFEPRWLEPLLDSLEERERLQFMGPCTDLVWRNELGWRHLPRARLDPWPGLQAPGWLRLDHERLAMMEQQRLKILARQLARDYQAQLIMPEPEAFVLRQLLKARQVGYLTPEDQERWLRQALVKGDEFWTRFPYEPLLARENLGRGEALTLIELQPDKDKRNAH